MKRSILSAALALGLLGAITLAAATNAEAKKPVSGSSTASISLASPLAPKLGDWVTFNYSYSGTISSPRIEIDCYQNGVMTFASAAPADQAQQLGGGSSQWLTNGGSATCNAILYYWDFHPTQTFLWLAQTSFNAAGN